MNKTTKKKTTKKLPVCRPAKKVVKKTVKKKTTKKKKVEQELFVTKYNGGMLLSNVKPTAAKIKELEKEAREAKSDTVKTPNMLPLGGNASQGNGDDAVFLVIFATTIILLIIGIITV